MNNNALSELPEDFHSCKHLRVVSLSRNRIRDFPVQLTYLKELEKLDLSHNRIHKIPHDFRDIHATEVNLNDNEVSVKLECDGILKQWNVKPSTVDRARLS